MAGIDDVTPTIEVQGADDAAEALKKLGDAGVEAFGRIGEAAAGVENASASIKHMTEGGAEALKHLGEVGAEAFAHILDAAMSGNFTGIATMMFGEMAGAITETTQKLFEFIEGQAEAIETLSNLAEATGMSTAEILGLREAFASVGISTNGFERSIGRLAITIANEWSQIQQTIRTSADAQAGSLQHVQQTAFNVQKAYESMGDAITHAAQTAQRDALGIEQAAQTLQRASSAMSDFATTTRSNANALEGAQLSLQAARNNLAKDQGRPVDAAAEKALKIAQDELAVKEAETRVEEARNKQAKEGMELEETSLKLKKARMDVADAEQKQADDAVKSLDRIKQAQMDIAKAELAAREAREKAHEQDLKDIPAIAREIDEVARGYKKWDDVINHTEVSAQSLTKALILASSTGGKEPAAMDVFREMSKLFSNMGDSADAMNKKLEIVQHTMGAGFRAGQASAAQLLAVLQRGPEALEHFKHEMEEFAHSLGTNELGNSTKALKEFNSSFAQLEGALDVVKTKMAAVMAVPLASFFDSLRESITKPGGELNHLTVVLAEFLSQVSGSMGRIFSGLGQTLAGLFAGSGPLFERLLDFLSRTIEFIADLITILGKLGAGWAIIGIGRTAFQLLAVAVDLVNLSIDGVRYSLGGMLIALGEVYAWYLKLSGAAKTFAEARNNDVRNAGMQIADSAKKDATKDAGNLAQDSATLIGVKTAADAEKAAADHSEKAAGKHSEAADKHTGAAAKHDAAADKAAASGEKGQQAATSLSDAGNKLQTSAEGLGNAASAMFKAASQLAQAIATMKPAGAKAAGGKISGPGGPTDDTAGLFALSDGEYVVKSEAVTHYGAPLFEALNNLSVGGFATGGAVGGPRAPNAPSITPAGPSSILNLSIDGQQFNGLKAPEHVATKLKTYAVGRQTGSVGKMPSWMR